MRPDSYFSQTKKIEIEILRAFSMSGNRPDYLAAYSDVQTSGTQVNVHLDCHFNEMCSKMFLGCGWWTWKDHQSYVSVLSINERVCHSPRENVMCLLSQRNSAAESNSIWKILAETA